MRVIERDQSALSVGGQSVRMGGIGFSFLEGLY
jgi:hypothetical protein